MTNDRRKVTLSREKLRKIIIIAVILPSVFAPDLDPAEHSD